MANILIPCAGHGQRFRDAGYELPKPLIDVCGKPLIQKVVESLNLDGRYIFCVLKEHQEKYGISEILLKIAPGATIIYVDVVTGGAVNTCLLAESLIDNNENLIIMNSDQLAYFDINKFIEKTNNNDGVLLVHNSDHPKWSYCQINWFGDVIQVVEKPKEFISFLANCGVYSWRRGSDFVTSARTMIENNDRTNGEFYIAPTYNYLIRDGKRIRIQMADRFLGCGVPSDLEDTIKILQQEQ